MSFRAPRWLRSALILLLVLPLILSAAPSDGVSTAPPDASLIKSGSQVRGGAAPDLVVLFAGEVMGWTEPCG